MASVRRLTTKAMGGLGACALAFGMGAIAHADTLPTDDDTTIASEGAAATPSASVTTTETSAPSEGAETTTSAPTETSGVQTENSVSSDSETSTDSLLAMATASTADSATEAAVPFVASTEAARAASLGDFSVSVTPTQILAGSGDSFTLSANDSNPTDEYFITGIPDTTWKISAGSYTVLTMSTDPLIYQVPKGAIVGGTITITPPRNANATAYDIQVLRPDYSQNLLTDFDNGTFDYIGNSDPTLLASTTGYSHHSGDKLVNTDLNLPTTNNYWQYGPMDGSYTIWPTAAILGPGESGKYLFNNKWADLRNATTTTHPFTAESSSLWASQDLTPDTNNYADAPVKKGSTLANTSSRKVIDATTRANSSKILVVNGQAQQVLTTTIDNLDVNSIYLFTGYFANVSFDMDAADVYIDFQLTSGGSSQTIGVSGALPKQSNWNNGSTSWIRVGGYIQAKSSRLTLSLNNHTPATGTTYGNDFAVDSLRLTPMTPYHATLKIVTGTVSWTKTADDETTPLAGSVWILAGTSDYSESVADCVAETDEECTGLDTDNRAGYFAVTGLSAGTYSITETTAPTGYTPKTGVVAAGELASDKPALSLGTITNTPIRGAVAWTKVGSSDSTTLVGGSEWTISPVDSETNKATASTEDDITVVDNGQKDSDTAAGRLKVTDLRYGNYVLWETKAPDGYVLSDILYPFTVATDGATVSVNGGSAITNAEKPGSISWSKVDSTDTDLLLTGSEWTLVGPNGTGTKTTSITDCVAENVGSCAGPDKDPDAGKFSVTNLAWGTYTLTESKAPAGYVNSQQSVEFTIDAAQLDIAHGAITNTPRDAVNLPLTGGLGRDAFLIGGFGILGGGAAAAGITYAIRRRKEVA